MKINFLVRLKNPVVWVQLVGTVVLTALSYFSMETTDVTTWGALFNLIKSVGSNPYLIGLCLWNIWGIINDPTTSGVSDSATAMTYTKPIKEIMTNIMSNTVTASIDSSTDNADKKE